MKVDIYCEKKGGCIMSHFMNLHQACSTCANAYECKRGSDLEQEICKDNIIRGGYGNWNKAIELLLTKESSEILIDVIDDYINEHKDDLIRISVLETITSSLKIKTR